MLSAFGAGAGSLSFLIGAVAQRLAPEQRSLAAGFVNAGGSLGQFVFAPLVQMAIIGFGWVNAMLALAAAMLTTLPLAWPLRRPEPASNPAAARSPAGEAGIGLGRQLAAAVRDPSYWWLNLGFFTCGFHVAFLVTHLSPSIAANSLAIIGIANIAGSLWVGWLGGRRRMKHLLFWIYLLRAAAVLVYMAAPKTALTFYVFAVALGLTWLATLPPTAGIIGKLFGVRYLSTLLGVSLAVHQLGGFYGAWLGGLAVANFGDYSWMWCADALLATLAALSNLPIREAPVARQAAPA